MSTVIDRRGRLSEQAYETLREMIVRGEMAPETRISEPELTQRLGISRTPLREALLRLAQDGLVSIFPQSGSFVAPIRLEEVEEAQFIREHLECAIIRQVAAGIDARGLAGLRSLLAQQQEASDLGDFERFYILDEAFHAEFCTLAGRKGVWRLIERSKVHMDRVRRLSLPIALQVPRLTAQHRAIVEAVGSGDATAAEAALRIHLREVFTTIDTLKLDRRAAPRSYPA
jgi:DNA-binding GntR family transcriptional regulator